MYLVVYSNTPFMECRKIAITFCGGYSQCVGMTTQPSVELTHRFEIIHVVCEQYLIVATVTMHIEI